MIPETKLLLLLALSAFIAACGGDGGGALTVSDNVNTVVDGSAGNNTGGGSNNTGMGSNTGTGSSGSGGSNTDGGSDIATGDNSNGPLYGFVELEDAGDAVGVFGLFGRFNRTLSVTEFTAAFQPQLDTCNTRGFANPDTGVTFDIDNNADSLVRAGDSLIITSRSGTYATVSRLGTFERPIYLLETNLSGPAPSGLTLDVSGDEFPAFTNMQVPDVANLVLTSPGSDQPVNANTRFRWNASGSSAVFLDMTASFFPDDGSELIVNCLIADDGDFRFPAEVRAAIGGNVAASLLIDRSVTSITNRDDAILVVRRTTD